MKNEAEFRDDNVNAEIGVLWEAPHQDDDPGEETIRKFAEAVLENRQALNCEIAIKIVTEEESQQLNFTYRHKNAPTNVLSFPLDGGLPDEQLLLGDIAICIGIVRKEALTQGKSVAHHMAHMVVHGVLHLLGFDHIEEDEAQEMEQIEREILRTIGIADPYLTGEAS